MYVCGIINPREVALRCMQNALTTTNPVPWSTEAAFTQKLFVNGAPNGKCTFHRPDLWHTVNLGLGKAFVASAIAVLEKAFPGRSRPVRFEQLNEDYKVFCRQNHLHKYLTKIDSHTFNVGGAEEPMGTWNKASVTANMCKFLEHLCEVYQPTIVALNDERTPVIVACINQVGCLNCFMFSKSLYPV